MELDRRVSRRRIVAAAMGIGAAAAAVHVLGDERDPATTYEIGLRTNGKPFGDVEANMVSERVGITAGSFFKFDSGLLDRLSAFKGDKLYPIYPPAVLAQKKVIYHLAKEYKIPPNVIATIMSVESAGNERAGSGAGAIGLFQPLSDKFSKEVQSIRDPDKKLQAMRQPLANGRAGMDYLRDFCLPPARELYPNVKPDDPRIYAWALIGYNGGSGRVGIPFDQLPDESSFYGDHAIRFFMTAEIAGGLRQKGYNDKQIVQALSSRSVDARAFGLSEWREKRGGEYPYYVYETVMHTLADPGLIPPRNLAIPKEELDLIGRSYKSHLENPVNFEFPASPGLRIWLSMGGSSLFQSVDKNVDLKAWKGIST